jgi:hypothetical protein
MLDLAAPRFEKIAQMDLLTVLTFCIVTPVRERIGRGGREDEFTP